MIQLSDHRSFMNDCTLYTVHVQPYTLYIIVTRVCSFEYKTGVWKVMIVNREICFVCSKLDHLFSLFSRMIWLFLSLLVYFVCLQCLNFTAVTHQRVFNIWTNIYSYTYPNYYCIIVAATRLHGMVSEMSSHSFGMLFSRMHTLPIKSSVNYLNTFDI